MSEAHDPRGRLPVLAVGLAVAAVAIAGLAAVVVVTRGGPASGPAAATGQATATGSAERAPPTLERTVHVNDLVDLDREAIAAVFDPGGARDAIGIKVTDPELRAALGLEATDVITTISGRAIRRQFDIHDALLGASTMNATVLYVELLHGGEPVLVRWQLEGDLRAARAGARARRPDPRRPSGADPFTRDPFSSPRGVVARAVPDPLLASITRRAELHYEVTRATVDQLVADPALLLRSARIVPANRKGQPDGVALYAIRPGTLLGALGFANGDRVQRVNGGALDGNNLEEVFTRVASASELTFELVRRGQPQVLKITITP